MTYSIIARDPQTGTFGAAAQSHFFAVGSVLAWAEAGHGVVATQAFVNPSYGRLGLRLMSSGTTSSEAMAQLIRRDPGAAMRQVAMIDASGTVATHTGARCVMYAGHVSGDQVSAQANMMTSSRVWPAMLAAYREAQGDMAHRLMASLKAGEDAGGDVRGRQSACILVVAGEPAESGGGKVVDLRVDDNEEPLVELERLLTLHEQYGVLERLLAEGMLTRSLTEKELAVVVARLRAAQAILGDVNQEFTFWRAMVLARAGRVPEAREAIAEAASRHGGWKEMLKRLPAAGLLPLPAEQVDALLP
ncbi:MAG: DUF1028 domain-containing protein [Candidatus Dormibacteraeota bacterium]|nr:DUF1028 domain-containing protein [Candidatus Dormibacteraeota bacterium]